MPKARPAGRRSPADRDASLGVSRAGADAPPAPRPDPAKAEAARRFAVEAARLLKDDKCENVAVLDLRGRSQVTEFFVVASGTSERQMRSAGEHVAELAESSGFPLFGGGARRPDAAWILLDCVDVVVHIFEPEKRLYYDLEMLWGDAPRIEWERPSDAPPPGVRGRGKTDASRNRAGLSDDDIVPGRR